MENPYIKYKYCQRHDDDSTIPAHSRPRSIPAFEVVEKKRLAQYTKSPPTPHITSTFHFIVSNPKSYDKVRRPFWKSGGMSSEYIEWVKLNIVPSHIHGALAKNCTHAQTHSIKLEMAKGFSLAFLFVCASRFSAFFEANQRI